MIVILYEINAENKACYQGEIELSRMPCIAENVCYNDASGNTRIGNVMSVFHSNENNMIFINKSYAAETYWRMEGISFG